MTNSEHIYADKMTLWMTAFSDIQKLYHDVICTMLNDHCRQSIHTNRHWHRYNYLQQLFQQC